MQGNTPTSVPTSAPSRQKPMADRRDQKSTRGLQEVHSDCASLIRAKAEMVAAATDEQADAEGRHHHSSNQVSTQHISVEPDGDQKGGKGRRHQTERRNGAGLC
jgi:hypothetical protein